MAVSILRRDVPETNPLQNSNLHPVLQRIFVARHITDSASLEYSLKQLISYDQLSGLDQAVELLESALRQQQRVIIIGDFDADGATSVTVAMRGLKKMGFQHLDYLVPNRFEFGYGLTPEIVAVAAESQPDLIITVDNGISSIDGVNAANECGIRVLVTDHHLPGKQLPQASAIVNPNNIDDNFPSKSLAGVGVIFYVLLALRAHLRSKDWFSSQVIAEPNLAELLDLVALGTVADVVPLDKNNRVLVSQGVARIRQQKCCAGIKALAQVAKRDLNKFVASDLAFGLGPRLNAAGRIEDMSLGIECLLSNDDEQAMQLAQQLDQLNHERRSIEEDMKQQALAVLDQISIDDSKSHALGICLYQPDWHQGVIGILASRIKEKYYRPAIIFAHAGQDEQSGEEIIKGSARSISNVHIRDALDSVAAKYPGMLVKFGGHAMAAGMTLRLKDFAEFDQAFNEILSSLISEQDCRQVIYSDGELVTQDMTLDLAQQIRNAGPWGQAFPEPMFDGVFDLHQRRIVGQHHLKLSVSPLGSTERLDAIAFRTTDHDWPEKVGQVQLAYKLDVNEYRGVQSVQLMVEYIEPIG